MDGVDLVFRLARLKAFLLAFICIAGGILAIKGSQPQFDVCIAMKPCALRPLMAYLGGIFFIICGPLLLWQAIKGVPLGFAPVIMAAGLIAARQFAKFKR